MRNINSTCLILLLSFITSACNSSTIKYYAFDKQEVQFSWGRLIVNIDGSYETREKCEIYGEPYTVRVRFVGDGLANCNVEITSLYLNQTQSDNLISKRQIKRVDFSEISKEYQATFAYDQITIPHIDISVLISGKVLDCNNKEDFQKGLKLKAVYKEENVSLWDRLMGI